MLQGGCCRCCRCCCCCHCCHCRCRRCHCCCCCCLCSCYCCASQALLHSTLASAAKVYGMGSVHPLHTQHTSHAAGQPLLLLAGRASSARAGLCCALSRQHCRATVCRGQHWQGRKCRPRHPRHSGGARKSCSRGGCVLCGGEGPTYTRKSSTSCCPVCMQDMQEPTGCASRACKRMLRPVCSLHARRCCAWCAHWMPDDAVASVPITYQGVLSPLCMCTASTSRQGAGAGPVGREDHRAECKAAPGEGIITSWAENHGGAYICRCARTLVNVIVRASYAHRKSSLCAGLDASVRHNSDGAPSLTQTPLDPLAAASRHNHSSTAVSGCPPAAQLPARR